MKKALSLTLLFSFFCALVFAGSGNNHYKVHKVPNWFQTSDDNITNVLMEVWPKGLYADIELTFTLNGANLSTGPTDSLQGILKFELPPNSFIHDSWLWLNDSIIISADLVERSKAIQIYSGYIQQRQDPSLLLKTGANNYHLNVFPISSTFARKVKITFSTLMTQKGDKAVLTLPTDILCASQNKPDFMALIHTNEVYTAPYFTNSNFNNFVVNTSNDLYLLDMPAGSYGPERSLDLVYATANVPTLTVYPFNANEGVYELKMPVEEPTVAPRHFSIILDHRPTGQWGYSSIYSFAEIKKMLQRFLTTNCSPTDSFNVFYTNSNTVVQAFPGWTAIEPATVNGLLDNIPNSISSETSKFKSLLETGIIFGQTKPSQVEHTILITPNSDYIGIQQASQLFTSVQTTVGTFTNKISVLNYAAYSSNMTPGSTILFNNFCATTGGTHFKLNGYYYDGYLNSYSYDLDMLSVMNGILNYMSGGHNSYNITLPLTTGFTYNSYNPSGASKYYKWKPYTEIGKYYGNITTGNAALLYISQNGPVNYPFMINAIDSGTDHMVRCWANNYLLDLESMNNSMLYSEILDSSINNRVLCYETAFLALENGDTVSGDTIKVATGILENENKTIKKVKCYPNPFYNDLTIESPEEMDEIAIYDITGRLAFYRKDLKSKTFTWNGQKDNGEGLSNGIYFIKVRYKDKQETIKVVKM